MTSSLRFKDYWQLFIAPLGQQKARLVQLLSSLLFLAFIQTCFFVLLGPCTQALFNSASLPAEITLGSLISPKTGQYLPFLEQVFIPKDSLLYVVPLGLLVVALLRNVANYFFAISTAALSLYLSKVYRDRFFAHIISQPFLAIQQKTPAEWMSHIMNDVLYLQTRFTDILNSFVRDSVVMISALLSIAFIHPPTALVIVLVAPCVAYGMGRTGKRIAVYAEAFQQELSNLAAHILELRRHFSFMRSQKGEQRELAYFSEINQAYYRRVLGSIMVRASFAPLVEWLGFVAFAVFVLVISRKAGQPGGFPLDNLLMFFAAFGLMLRPLRNFGEQLAKFHETKGALAKSLHYLTHWQTVHQAAPDTTINSSAPVQLAKLVGGYPEGRVRVNAENILLPRGRSIAVVGASGSGKSTLIKLLAGLIAADHWEGSLSQDECAASVSMVSQAPFLFAGTIRENLLYGLKPDEKSDEDLYRIIDLVAMKDLVKSLPQGLDYPLESMSGNLSGGQIQRLVIARGLLRNAPVLLLDEATSAVDEATEAGITAALLKLCRTEHFCVLAITHRLHLLSMYDEVWFMRKGQIAMRGSLAELQGSPEFLEFALQA